MTSDLLNVVVTDAGTLKFPPNCETTQHMGVRTVRAGPGSVGWWLVRRAGVCAGRAASLHYASSSRHSDVRNNTSSCTNQQLTKGWVATE